MWLFQVQEHLNLMVILERGHIPYAPLLLHRNATLWWRDLCKGNNRPTTWNEFRRLLLEQFWPKHYSRCGRDDLAEIW